MKDYIISEKEEGMTLLKYSFRLLPGAGQGMIRKFLRNKNIELNSKKAGGNEILKAGDRVSFFLSDGTFAKFHGSQKTVSDAKPLEKERIIYEDEDILIYNKEAGELSQSDSSGAVSVNDRLLSYSKPDGAFTPSVCNRLDRNTSGLILCGLSSKGLQTLTAAIRDRQLKKYYLAVCEGRFEKEGPAKLWLRKDESKNISRISDTEKPGYDPVETIFTIIKTTEDATLLEAEIVTGKPHQIRASLSHLGHPIVGDLKYGAKKGMAKRHLLHAVRIVFPPDILDGRTFEAPLPYDIRNYIIENKG
ncbi:MAG: RluA family pseudouridine synthase [Lachnospiraceae bacterium]|nr:RluA family pseudouridine synthase [Lachnospiraceae bacterium]